MLGFNISNITSSQYRESIDKSSIDIDYKPLSDRGGFDKTYSKNLLTSISHDVNYSNTLISTDFYFLQENSKKIIENPKNKELVQTDKILEVFACSAAKKSVQNLPMAVVKKEEIGA